MGDVEEKLDEAINLIKKTSVENNAIIAALVIENRNLKQEIEDLKCRVEVKKKDGIEKELFRKYRKKRKDIILHRMMDLIQARDYTLPELKDIIVDDMQYCSKASFYRYFEELKNRGMVILNGDRIGRPITR